MNNFLVSEKTGLWVVDMQNKLLPFIDRSLDIIDTVCFALRGAEILKLPVVVTEQYPAGLGSTVENIKKNLPSGQLIFPKTTFSGYADPSIRREIGKSGITHWILVGIEAHVCVLQTAKDLLLDGKKVIVLNDGTSSRSIYNYSTAIGELRDMGVRISSAETIFYELIKDASHPEFKQFLPLMRSVDGCCAKSSSSNC